MDLQTIIDIVLKLVAITVVFTVVLLIVAYTVLAERRVLGFIQGRLGPNRVGYGGVLQPFADLLKFILKEDIVPDKSTRFIYFLAPIIVTMAALMTMIVYPFGPEVNLPFLARLPLIGQYLHPHIVAVPIHVGNGARRQIMHKRGGVLAEHGNIGDGFDCFHGGCGVSEGTLPCASANSTRATKTP